MVLQIIVLISYFMLLVLSFTRFRCKALDVLVYVFSLLIYSFRNLEEADTVVYNLVYTSVSNGGGYEVASKYGIDFGFYLIMKVIGSLGIPFFVFRMIGFIVASILIYSTIKLITNNNALVFCLYLFFPFGYDSDQIRQFLAYSIVIFAIRYLIKEDKHPIKYIICVALATSFHSSTIAFLLFLLVLVKKRNYMKYLIRVVGVISVLFAIGGGNIIGLLGRFINNEKILRYSLANTSYRMNIYLQFFEIGMVIVFLMIDNYILSKRNDEISSEINMILHLSFVFLPLVLYSLAFERMIRPFIILTYAVTVSEFESSSSRNKYIYLFSIIGLIIIRMSVSFAYITDLFNDCTLFV